MEGSRVDRSGDVLEGEEIGIKINEQVFEYLIFYPGKILFFYVRHKKTFSP